MGKTKRMLDDFHLSQEEITDELYARGDEDYQYQKWLTLRVLKMS